MFHLVKETFREWRIVRNSNLTLVNQGQIAALRALSTLINHRAMHKRSIFSSFKLSLLADGSPCV
jgi:hypothetical protein